MENEIYKAPEADLVTEETLDKDAELASRLKRWFASIIDTLILFIVLIPLMFVIGYFDSIMEGIEPGLGESILLGVFTIGLFAAINYKFLAANGQTIGKKLLSIKVVAIDGSPATISEHFLKRYFVYFVPNQVPVIGGVFGLVNILCIFRKDRRCIHDLFAKTKVVNC